MPPYSDVSGTEEKQEHEKNNLISKGQKIWKSLLTNTLLNNACLSDQDQKIADILLGIRILDSSDHQNWLTEYGAHLYNIPEELLKRLEERAPKIFHARVMDFNENLCYSMQTELGLECLGMSSDPLKSIIKSSELLLSFMSTEKTNPQPAHVDFTWDFLRENAENVEIGFFPLTQDGMFLQLWPRVDDISRSVIGEVIFIPYGKLLTVPSGTIHGGGFRTSSEYTPHGNLRSHIYISKEQAHLGRFQTNKYTEPHDPSRELSERYIDCQSMPELTRYLFH